MLSVRSLPIVLLVGAIIEVAACSPEPQTDERISDSVDLTTHVFYVLPGFASEADARARLVWEAAKALVGPTQATGYTWPASKDATGNYVPVPGSFQYAADDPGAWTSLRVGYTDANNVLAGDLSCMGDNNSTLNSSPCLINYGSLNPNTYGYQPDKNTSTYRYRGGQCRAFSNLVAYRSGVYHGTNWAFKRLPIALGTQVTPSNLQNGDVLRSNQALRHSVIVVRKFTDTDGVQAAVVLDSNFVGSGNGGEAIGSHVLRFSGSGNNNLGNYYAYNCIYSGNCQ